MKRRKLSKSLRKYIRREKARIRREILNVKEQKEAISKLYPQLKEEEKVTNKK